MNGICKFCGRRDPFMMWRICDGCARSQQQHDELIESINQNQVQKKDTDLGIFSDNRSELIRLGIDNELIDKLNTKTGARQFIVLLLETIQEQQLEIEKLKNEISKKSSS